VQMPESLQLVCRATVDALDVGEIARSFGGGGHNRAAAAAIRDQTLDEVVNELWEAVYKYIQPVTRVSDLMSYGAHTVEAKKLVKDVVGQLRRIGHEGYPVAENGQIVGLLTRRDLDRAAEHGLTEAEIREIMSEGQITLNPSDSISTLEQRMVESGWGQIPVVEDGGKLIGIVTRTDLIKHWARIHPPTKQTVPTVTPDQLITVFGKDVTRLINTISQHAQASNTTLYMVGGVVRDLLLNRKNLDIDFVVETDAIEFAGTLQAKFGGKLSSFRPFGTAKWILDETVSAEIRANASSLPEHIDFATARNEFYEHPTALPTVYNSSIKLDLARRDFTINTLAVQLSPASFSGRILDFYGGLNDLNTGLIRVLHSLSFVDDPTRILRAVRFEQRLSFQIEPRTADLIETSRPMLGRITGERLRNELWLLLRESEPERGLRELAERGILTGIHPAFTVPDQLETWFKAARSFTPPWEGSAFDLVELYWHLIAIHIPSDQIKAWSERLLFSQSVEQSMLAARRVVEKADILSGAETRPSQMVSLLKDTSELALAAAWITLNDPAREAIRRYWTVWQHQQPTTNGNTLRERGLKPGPCYSLILTRLRTALLDGEIKTEADERSLLESLIKEGICDDRA
jgi:tRNA nucleotidyltransferase (CCA-adding enzyme)